MRGGGEGVGEEGRECEGRRGGSGRGGEWEGRRGECEGRRGGSEGRRGGSVRGGAEGVGGEVMCVHVYVGGCACVHVHVVSTLSASCST